MFGLDANKASGSDFNPDTREFTYLFNTNEQFAETSGVGDADNNGNNELIIFTDKYQNEGFYSYNIPSGELIWQTTEGRYNPQGGLHSMEVFDIDNDDVNEIITSFYDDETGERGLALIEYSGSNTISYDFIEKDLICKLLRVGDADSDGNYEIICVSRESESMTLNVFEYSNDFSKTSHTINYNPDNSTDAYSPNYLVLGNVDSDSDDEILLSGAGSHNYKSIFVFDYESNSLNKKSSMLKTQIEDSWYPVAIIGVGDVDNDGKNEIIMGNKVECSSAFDSEDIRIYNTGFELEYQKKCTNGYGAPEHMIITDMNNDEVDDIVIGGDYGLGILSYLQPEVHECGDSECDSDEDCGECETPVPLSVTESITLNCPDNLQDSYGLSNTCESSSCTDYCCMLGTEILETGQFEVNIEKEGIYNFKTEFSGITGNSGKIEINIGRDLDGYYEIDYTGNAEAVNFRDCTPSSFDIVNIGDYELNATTYLIRIEPNYIGTEKLVIKSIIIEKIEEEIVVENYCGDGTCSTGEDCSTCEQDCGACETEYYCGDSICNSGEDCSYCPEDCLSSGECCGMNNIYADPGYESVDDFYETDKGVVPNSMIVAPESLLDNPGLVWFESICCDGEIINGDCCYDYDCDEYEECVDSYCRERKLTVSEVDELVTSIGNNTELDDVIEYYEKSSINETEQDMESVLFQLNKISSDSKVSEELNKINGESEDYVKVQKKISGKVGIFDLSDYVEVALNIKSKGKVNDNLEVIVNEPVSTTLAVKNVYYNPVYIRAAIMYDDDFSYEERKYVIFRGTPEPFSTDNTLLDAISWVGRSFVNTITNIDSWYWGVSKAAQTYYTGGVISLEPGEVIIFESKITPKETGELRIKGLVQNSVPGQYFGPARLLVGGDWRVFQKEDLEKFQERGVSKTIMVNERECGWFFC